MSTNDSASKILKESLLRKSVQFGTVTDIKKLPKPGDDKNREEIVEVFFYGVSVYIEKSEFSDRKMASFKGFLSTTIPFIIIDTRTINGEEVWIGSRIQALPIVQKRFLKFVSEGDTVLGTVTGVLDEKQLVYVEVQGFPCLIPPGEWDLHPVTVLSEVVAVGSQIDIQIMSIENIAEKKAADSKKLKPDTDDERDANWEYDFKIRVSRRSLLKDEKARMWDEIEKFHMKGDSVVGKIVHKLPSRSSYLIELAKSGIVIMGNLQDPLNNKYRNGLPQGVEVHAEILSLDQNTKTGRARIFRVDPSFYTTMGTHGI
jgi:ribosomal protein S1